MAKHKEEPRKTTINVSPLFAELVTDLARQSGLSVRDYCDKRWSRELRQDLKKSLRKRLEAVELGEAGA